MLGTRDRRSPTSNPLHSVQHLNLTVFVWTLKPVSAALGQARRHSRLRVRPAVPGGHVEASLDAGMRVATMCHMPLHTSTDGTSEHGRPSSQVVRLIDRIKHLVAEQRRLDEGDSEDRRRANRREIARLKWRLANVVKRELSPGTGLRFVLAFRP
jgi:hypothetical protein